MNAPLRLDCPVWYETRNGASTVEAFIPAEQVKVDWFLKREGVYALMRSRDTLLPWWQFISTEGRSHGGGSPCDLSADLVVRPEFAVYHAEWLESLQPSEVPA